jgi:hypothetical protein
LIGWDAKREREIKARGSFANRWISPPTTITANKVWRPQSKPPIAIRARHPDRRSVLQKVVVERGAAKGFTLDQLRRARDHGARSFKRRGKISARRGCELYQNIFQQMRDQG